MEDDTGCGLLGIAVELLVDALVRDDADDVVL